MDCPRPPPSLSGKRILVLEDEAFLVWELVEALEAAGALPMASSHSVRHGLEAIRSAEPFDAAILNVWLHGELSFPIADELHQRGIPFVFVTGSSTDAKRQYPEVTCHPKPADMGAVVVDLAAVIARRGG